MASVIPQDLKGPFERRLGTSWGLDVADKWNTDWSKREINISLLFYVRVSCCDFEKDDPGFTPMNTLWNYNTQTQILKMRGQQVEIVKPVEGLTVFWDVTGW